MPNDGNAPRKMTRPDLPLVVVTGAPGFGKTTVAEALATDPAPLRALPAARIVQLFCSAPDAIVLDRYAQRRRHARHLDHEIAAELRGRLAARGWRPLDLGGTLIAVDTARPVDAWSVARAVGR